MNRSIVIFVALTILIAHSLAIRTNVSGDLAPPYDQAFVAFRVARNLIFEGEWIWFPGQSGFDSYPSTLWVLVCAVAERFAISVNTAVRAIGVAATATSLIMATRFHSERAASLITPLLLAISGAMAAAAVSGTETALFTALVTGSFLAYERRWERSLGVLLLFSGLARGEGWVLALVFLALRLRDRSREKGAPSKAGSLLPFLAPLTGLVMISVLRYQLNGYWSPPWLTDLVNMHEGEITNGIAYVREFFISCASPALILYAVWYLLRRNLSMTGKRALVLFMTWTGLTVLQGGGQTPFSEAMVPILPITLIAGQEGLITALNSLKAPVRALAWVSFLLAVVASIFTSFRPSESGPASLGRFQRSWMQASAAPRFGFDDQLGRIGLDEEAEATRVLRDIAIFMRDEVDPRRTVLTPWPGSLAYLSSLPVRDLLGRATPAPPRQRTSFAPNQLAVDTLAALENQPDYIVPFWRERNECPTTDQVAEAWMQSLDSSSDQPGRGDALREALSSYEVIAVPLVKDPGKGLASVQNKAYILRRRELEESPILMAQIDDSGELRVEVEHSGHQQLGGLAVKGTSSRGETWCMTPAGRFVRGKQLLVRPNLLLTETGERRIELLRTSLKDAPAELISLRVTLLNPKSANDSPSMQIAKEVALTIPRD
jgi:hypothetical protein